MENNDNEQTRREFLRRALRGASLAGMGCLVGLALTPGSGEASVWQIDPAKCTSCGNCATACVLEESAVKGLHAYGICGYCRICFGFFDPQPHAINEGAENQMCPMGAIKRTYVEEPYYEYAVDESLCIGCGKCVEGCNTFGNGSMHLQVRHDRCVNCNQCTIALTCPTCAIQRIPAGQPYLFKKEGDV